MFPPDPDTLMAALRQKAAGERNSLGDVWTDAICGDAADMIGKMAEALEGILTRYVDMVNSGDCGFWNPEEEVFVIAARSALTRATGG